MNKNEIKILAGITEDDELYFLNVTTERDGKPYFSMTGETVRPITLEDAIDQSYESTKSLIEEQTKDINDLYLRDIDDIVQDVIDSDGNLSGIDTSLYPESVTVDNQEYVFESCSCGQHEEKTLKHYFINQDSFRMLLKAWELYHMKDIGVDKIVLPMPYNSVSVGYMLDNMPKQNIEALVMQAITTINSEQ